MNLVAFRAIAAVGLAVLSSCTTMESSTDRRSGFLSDYERLQPDRVGGTSWHEEGFKLSKYDAVYVPSAELWVTEEHLEGLEPEDGTRLINFFRAAVVEQLAEHGWELTDQPGPRVCSVRLALTELEGANPYGNFITSLPVQTTMAIKLLAITADVHVFVGEVSTEVQIVDASTGEVLAEGLDKRVGAHELINIGSTWGDVEDAMDVWAERIAEGLSKLEE